MVGDDHMDGERGDGLPLRTIFFYLFTTGVNSRLVVGTAPRVSSFLQGHHWEGEGIFSYFLLDVGKWARVRVSVRGVCVITS